MKGFTLVSREFTIKQLKELIADLPDDSIIGYTDPNFGYEYSRKPEGCDFTVNEGRLFISFPFEEELD